MVIKTTQSTVKVFKHQWLQILGKCTNKVKYAIVKRSRTLTEKGKEYQLKTLFEKSKKLHARMARKYKLVDDLLYSSSNVTTVKEETDQFNDQFKELLSLHKEYVRLLPQEVVDEEDD